MTRKQVVESKVAPGPSATATTTHNQVNQGQTETTVLTEAIMIIAFNSSQVLADTNAVRNNANN